MVYIVSRNGIKGKGPAGEAPDRTFGSGHVLGGHDEHHLRDVQFDTVEELIRNPERKIKITEPQKVFERNSVKPFFQKQEKEHEKR